jgi:hypothetical protein
MPLSGIVSSVAAPFGETTGWVLMDFMIAPIVPEHALRGLAERPAVERRVDRLEADGVLQGYFAQVDPARGTQTQVVLSTLFERPF